MSDGKLIRRYEMPYNDGHKRSPECTATEIYDIGSDRLRVVEIPAFGGPHRFWVVPTECVDMHDDGVTVELRDGNCVYGYFYSDSPNQGRTYSKAKLVTLPHNTCDACDEFGEVGFEQDYPEYGVTVRFCEACYGIITSPLGQFNGMSIWQPKDGSSPPLLQCHDKNGYKVRKELHPTVKR